VGGRGGGAPRANSRLHPADGQALDRAIRAERGYATITETVMDEARTVFGM